MALLPVLRLLILVVALGLFLRAAGGRLAPKMALAPMFFLLTRTPVLIAWALGAIGMYVLMAKGAAENNKTPDPMMMIGISAFCGIGFAALVVGPGFMIARSFAAKPEFLLEEGEIVQEKIAANHMLGREARGGVMVLTDRRIGFEPHRFNVQLDTWSVPRASVRGARREGSRLLLLETDRGEEIFVAAKPEAIAARVLGVNGSCPTLERA